MALALNPGSAASGCEAWAAQCPRARGSPACPRREPSAPGPMAFCPGRLMNPASRLLGRGRNLREASPSCASEDPQLAPSGPRKTLQRVPWTHEGPPAGPPASRARRLSVSSVPLLASFLPPLLPYSMTSLFYTFLPFLLPLPKNGMCSSG